MVHCSLQYENHEQLQTFVAQQTWNDKSSILVQVFTGSSDFDFIQNLIATLQNLIPQVHILGATTSGEIHEEHVLESATVLSFSVFENTFIKTQLLKQENLCSFELGKQMMRSLPESFHEQALKAIMTFTNVSVNAEEYLNGMTRVNDETPIAGGIAGDNAAFKKTYVFTQEAIIEDGAVAVGLYNDKLNVYTDYNFSWQSLGRNHWVDQSEKNRVYKIDEMTAVEFYSQFLGKDIANMLPCIGVEFPLIVKKDGVDVARAVMKKHDDGSLEFAGNIPEGSSVKFGYGDVQLILNEGVKKAQELIHHPVEAIYVYSCMARKALLQAESTKEILPYQKIAPTSGFFTYGEFFYHKKRARLLNHSMTFMALSESDATDESKNEWFENNPEYNEKSMEFYRSQAMAQLISKITNELEELNGKLGYRVSQELKNSMEKDEIIFANARYAQMGEILDMIIHQWRQPLNIFSAGISSLQLYHNMGVLTDEMFNKTTMQVLKNVEFLNTTIEDFRGFFKDFQVKENIRPSQLLDKAAQLLESLFKKRGIELQRKIDCDEPIEVYTGELVQVLINILKNALDAFDENDVSSPVIYCKVHKEQSRCIFEIFDNAGGIPEHILPKIFDKRFTTKGDKHGTGIGLDMSKRIVQEHLLGTLTAENLNDGAVFTITIPLQTSLS